MTREEYERLLKSDYWKGYSYSLIKERNFTCEDCGRRFPNERNKLQVHHLVYRDVNPWSYRPDEVIVLCEECHRKRHGIKDEPSPNTHETWRGFAASTSTDTFPSNDGTDLDRNRIDRGYRYTIKHRRKFKLKYVLFILLLACVLSYYWDSFSKQKEETRKTRNTETNEKIATHRSTSSAARSKRPTHAQSAEETPVTSSNKLIDENESYPETQSDEDNGEELSTLELLERRNHADVVEQARHAGVSTEGTTLEILERINHADVVKQAKRAGVSTEGSTLEILERINHADVVEQARRAGVSTEGSTLEILERINHADVVKQARRAGVSTEGTTLEILERINRRELERNDM